MGIMVATFASPVLRGPARTQAATAQEEQDTADSSNLHGVQEGNATLPRGNASIPVPETPPISFPTPETCAKAKVSAYGSQCMCEACCMDPRYPKACNGGADTTMGTC